MHTLHFCTLPTVQECKECTGGIPEFEMMTTEFFPGVPLYSLQWFTALRPISGEQSHPCCRARKLQPCGKFLSILGNFRIAQCWLRFGITQASLVLHSPCATFPSRISFRYAENVPNMPKRSTPLESPRQRGQSRACPDYAECSRGKTVGQSPERLNRKPYTPIAPQLNPVRL